MEGSGVTNLLAAATLAALAVASAEAAQKAEAEVLEQVGAIVQTYEEMDGLRAAITTVEEDR